VTLEDIQYHLYVLEKIDKGIKPGINIKLKLCKFLSILVGANLPVVTLLFGKQPYLKKIIINYCFPPDQGPSTFGIGSEVQNALSSVKWLPTR